MCRSDPWVDVRTVCTTPPFCFLSLRRGPLASGEGRVDRGRCRSPLFGGPGTPPPVGGNPVARGGEQPPCGPRCTLPVPSCPHPPAPSPISTLAVAAASASHAAPTCPPPPHVPEAASPACRPRTRQPSAQPSAGNVTPPPPPFHHLPAQVTRTPPSLSGSAAQRRLRPGDPWTTPAALGEAAKSSFHLVAREGWRGAC